MRVLLVFFKGVLWPKCDFSKGVLWLMCDFFKGVFTVVWAFVGSDIWQKVLKTDCATSIYLDASRFIVTFALL